VCGVPHVTPASQPVHGLADVPLPPVEKEATSTPVPAPAAPVAPVAPIDPVGPMGPLGPAGPVGPVVPTASAQA